jgi:DNA-binding HxlR family transcriptional regulator
MKASEIIALFPDDSLESKALSRELGRMVEKGILVKEDASGKGAVYTYRVG